MEKRSYGVLILHGFTASLDCVGGIDAKLKESGIPTVMPVLRGHGAESPEALRGVTWHDWVADGAKALDHLSKTVDRVFVFGHSMGGLVALTLAADYPKRVDGLVLAAAAVRITSPLAPGKLLSFLIPILRRLLKIWNFSPEYADPELAKHDTNYTWAPIDTIASFLEFTKTARDRLPEIKMPVRILQPRNDSTVDPKSAEIIHDNISSPPEHKRIIWFDKTDHEMFRDCERELAIETVVRCVKELAESDRASWENW